MRAARATELNDPDSVEVTDIDAPKPGPGQVLIEVRAPGLSLFRQR